MPDSHTDPDSLLASIDPFAALADGRRQLLAAIEEIEGDLQELAETLGIVAAHDLALRDVALAFAAGARDFSDIVPPGGRPMPSQTAATVETIEASRAAVFEAIASVAEAHDAWLDEVIETPWGGRESWRMHLVALAMHDGARAHAISNRDVRDTATR